jgi:N-acetylglutamate synthase-like GNAT family acetyltransferase
MMYRQITVRDAAYEKEKELRSAVLRKPLGLELSKEDIKDDANRDHLVAIDSLGRVVGCVLMSKEGDAARIRQMAVAESVQHQGIGRALIQRMEKIAIQMECKKATMHARCLAQGFYEKLGYKVISSVFLELEIPHVVMEKTLSLMAPNERS